MAKVYATGRRKTAIAKVWLENGNGQLTINGQTLDAWLGGHESIKKRVMQPLNVSKQETSVNIVATSVIILPKTLPSASTTTQDLSISLAFAI